MTVEQILRRIEKECRDSEKLQCYFPLLKEAQAEARGAIVQCREIRALCRKLRREHGKTQLEMLR